MKLKHFESVSKLADQFSDLPIEAVFKQDILREGLSFSPDSLRIASGYKPKDYFIFSFDLIPIAEMQQEEHLRAPEEIQFRGGSRDLLPTIVSVRVNPNSPWQVRLQEGQLRLYCEEEEISEVLYHPVPAYYKRQMSNGKALGEVAPVIEWGYLIYLTVYRMCQYFNREEQCQFCDLNRNYEQQRKAGRPYTAVKSEAEILEALLYIKEEDTVAKALTITGGSIIENLRGEGEVSFYARYAKAIQEQFSDRWIIKAVVQAFTRDDCKLLKDSGVRIYHPNYEVWDPKLFPLICPGKTRVIGRDEWIARIVDSAEVFGPECVIPNFVAGVEMNQNYGYSDVEEAISSTKAGLEFFMSKGIMPRFTSWCPEPHAKLGPQPAPPLLYFCRLLQEFRDTFRKYQLPEPIGYGPVGAGKAVFSVSAFMDVL
ncbi:MAG: radical SAM protein [Candidatus Cloacimonetes bacterium]|nr:radical SAM protein [Candidatus Cloacimonadota bacterium]